MSRSAKWSVAVICGVVGVLALVVAVIYGTVPIHELPGFVPGGHPGYGTYHKRGALAGLIAVVLLVIAVVVGISARRAGASQNQVPKAQASEPEAVATPSAEAPGTEDLVSSPEDHTTNPE